MTANSRGGDGNRFHQTRQERTSLNNLVAMLRVQPYAAIMDGDDFFGLITRSDVLNYMRRQTLMAMNKDDKKTRFSNARNSWRPGSRTCTTGAIMPPIFATSTYVQESPGAAQSGFEYSRTQNPTRRMAYEALHCRTSNQVRRHGFAFASGMAATSTILELIDSWRSYRCNG